MITEIMSKLGTTIYSGSRLMGNMGNNNNNVMFVTKNAERSSSDQQDNNSYNEEYNNNVTANTSCCTQDHQIQNGSESPLSSNIFNDFSKNILTSPTSSTSPKKSTGRRSVQKRVVSIPIKEVEGSRLKGDSTSTPPSDSWAWRKYGQKPIKGSPYPRGYYRCSSSKGCPARKQVERSRVDPTMLVVTYSSEHNHAWPTSNRTHHHSHSSFKKPVKEEEEEVDEEEEEETQENSSKTDPEPEPEPKIEGIGFGVGLHGVVGEELIGSWFGSDTHMESAPSVMDIPMSLAEIGGACESRAAVFPVNMMGEEDESLFADLGELPECSLVFRHGRGQVEIC